MKKNDIDKNSIGCLAMYGALELQPFVQQVVDSMVKCLKSLSRKSDGQFVVVDLRLDIELDAIKDLFSKSYTKEGIMPMDKKQHPLDVVAASVVVNSV
nr:hypothetical protein [Tanacetum cinerariifolium]